MHDGIVSCVTGEVAILTQRGLLHAHAFTLGTTVTEPRVKSSIWAAALIRRAEVNGASAFVVKKGDPDSGVVLVKVSLLNGTARVWSATYGRDGQRRWVKATGVDVVADAEAEDYIARARKRDSDLWVVEVEDRAGRDFLTEEKE
jgi:hypothetical protein